MLIFKKLSVGLIAGSIMLTASVARAQDEITVAYFLEWPMPFQYAKVKGLYDEALGVDVNWVSFDTGTAMSAAMASGDVQLAVSQGVPPFVVATSAGQDLQILDVAVSYSDNDNCVVHADHEIDKESAGELAGKKVAVPLGTAAHYGFLRQMSHFEVDIGTLDIVDMPPAEGAVALSQGDVDMACGWGGGLRRMLDYGNVLLTGAEKVDLGILVFDVTSAPTSFVAENEELIAKFLKVTADANAAWNAGQTLGFIRDEMMPVIAQDSGLDTEGTAGTLSTFVFPSTVEQLSDRWFDGSVQAFLKGVADVFLEAGSIDSARDTYAGAVNTGPLSIAAGM